MTYSDKILRIVKVHKNKIQSVATGDIPAGVVKADKIERHKMFADFLDELKNNAKPKKITSKEVIAALPEEKVFLKIIEIPKMPIEKIDSAIVWQLESIIPFEEKDVYYNWRIIGESGNKLKVFVAISEKKIVDSLFEALRVAKLKPLIITFPSAGLANLLAHSNKLSIIVDLSKQENIFLVAARNKNVYFSTSRHIGSNYQDLEKIISSTIEYYKKKYPNEEIGQVLIFGPPALSEIEEKLETSFSSQIRLGHAADIKVIKNIKEKYVSYIDNLGLDMNLDDLSLLPPEIRQNTKNENTNYKLSSIVNYFILIILAIGIFYGIFWGKIYLDTNRLQNEYNDIKNYQSNSKQKELEEEINKLNNKIKLIRSLDLSKSIKPSLIEKITSVVDENIRLKELSISQDKKVTIKGIAKNRNDLIIFKDKLNNLNIMEPLDLPINALEKKEDVDFTLETSLKN